MPPAWPLAHGLQAQAHARRCKRAAAAGLAAPRRPLSLGSTTGPLPPPPGAPIHTVATMWEQYLLKNIHLTKYPFTLPEITKNRWWGARSDFVKAMEKYFKEQVEAKGKCGDMWIFDPFHIAGVSGRRAGRGRVRRSSGCVGGGTGALGGATRRTPPPPPPAPSLARAGRPPRREPAPCAPLPAPAGRRRRRR